MAVNAWSVVVTLPCASYASARARPFTISTPFNKSGRNSAVSGVSSGTTRLRTRPFGLSAHSAAYTIGPRCSATRPRSASTCSWATMRRTGMGRFNSMTSPARQVRSIVTYP